VPKRELTDLFYAMYIQNVWFQAQAMYMYMYMKHGKQKHSSNIIFHYHFIQHNVSHTVLKTPHSD